MFGLGFWEIVLILLAVIVFVKPQELPRVFFRVGRVYGQLLEFNRSTRNMMRRLEQEINEGEREDSSRQESPTSRHVSSSTDPGGEEKR